MKQSAKAVTEKLYTQINSRFQSGFVQKSRGVNSALSRYVNKELNNMFKEMITGGHDVYIGASTTPHTLAGVHWKPLAATTLARKGNSRGGFFKDSGELFAQLQGGLTENQVVKYLGGYSNKSVVTTHAKHQYNPGTNQLFNVQTGRLMSVGNAKLNLSFTVLNKLMIRKNPETLLDFIYRNSSSVPISTKLGVHENRRLRYHRNLIKPYARYYAKTVLPGKIKRWLKSKK